MQRAASRRQKSGKPPDDYCAILGAEAIEAKLLEQIVLGDDKAFLERLDHKTSVGSDDEAPEEISIGREGGDGNRPINDSVAGESARKPAWKDADDEKEVLLPTKRRLRHLKRSTDISDAVSGSEYQKRLKEDYIRKINMDANPEWAKLGRKKQDADSDSESDSSNDDSFAKQLSVKGQKLRKNVLAYKQQRDVTFGHRFKGAIVKNVEFHAQANVLLISGESQHLQLFQIDGKENPLLQSIAFDRFPIDTAHFSAEGNRVLVGSRLQSHAYAYDMVASKMAKIPCPRLLEQRRMDRFVVSPCGRFLALYARYGYIHLLSAKTYELIHSFKMNGEVSAVTFTQTGDEMYSFGDQGEVYIWDMARFECSHRFFDDGCVKGICLALSKDGRYLTCGQNTGVVNIYDRASVLRTSEPKPLKAVMNLTTEVTQVRFNSSGELLCMASEYKNRAIRLLHVGSLSVFENFPERMGPLGYPRAFDFSPNSGYMCVGDRDGHARLYRLQHYAEY